MKTKLNTTTLIGIIILAITGLITAGLSMKFLLTHPETPWYVTYSLIPQIQFPVLLTSYMGFAYAEWLPMGVSMSGGLLGGVLIYSGLSRSRA